MIYLDYAANTPVDKRVLDTFYKVSIDYFGNPNSPHALGDAAREKMLDTTQHIANLLRVKPEEVIYTSGASESNNMAIKGIAECYKRYGKHIITTFLEHASVTGPVSALKNQGYEIDFVNVTKTGQIDLEHLKELIREDTILVSVCYVDSEVGTIQPIKEISEIAHLKKHCYLHVDATQGVGKIPVSFDGIDLMTFSAHKFYGINGSGVLIKKDNIMLEPLIHGGLSTTSFRSGTPALGLAAALEEALSSTVTNLEDNLSYVGELNQILRASFSENKYVVINSPEEASPYILNISIKGVNTNKFSDKLSENEIYVATKSACCAPNTVSKPVFAITKDKKLALSTIRISLSHLTTKEEIQEFLNKFYQLLKEEL
jgi:cysteine desulfurase